MLGRRFRAGSLRSMGKTSRVLLAAAATAGVGVAGVGVAAGIQSAGAASFGGGNCPTVNIIVARASTELPGTGIIGSLALMAKGDVHGTATISPVNYPALLFPYAPSTDQGDAAIKAQLTQEVTNCPNTKIVMMGYSQGAQLVGDALGGGGGTFGLGAKNPPVSADIASHVIAVVQMGDPRRMPGLSFDKGSAVNATGLFPRQPDQSLASFSNIFVSYCDVGDPFCARGLNVLAHLDYTIKYDGAANAFIQSKLQAAGV